MNTRNVFLTVIFLFSAFNIFSQNSVNNQKSRHITYYVSPSGDDSNSGTSVSSPFKTIAAANAMVQPGDTVFLRSGDYKDPIKPAKSGQEGQYITYKVYGNEKPILTATTGPGISIHLPSGINYICVDGIYADGRGEHYEAYTSTIASWLVIGGSYNIIQNCNFHSALGWLGVDILETATYNRILNNRMDLIGTINIAITNNNESKADLFEINGDYNLIEGNHFSRGGHNIIGTSPSANYNVIRNNLIENDWGDGKRYRGFAPKGINLWEGNIITKCGYVEGQRTTMNVGVFQFDQAFGIIRHNLFMNNYAKGMNAACWDKRLANNLRVFHNVFFNHASSVFSFGGWGEWCAANPASNNYFKNNLIYNDGSMTPDPKFIGDPFIKFDGNAVIADNRFIANSFYENGKEIMVALPNDSGKKSLLEMETLSPDNFSENIIDKPIFAIANPTRYNHFKLLSGSPQIDKAAFLTITVGAGNGKTLKVDDPYYFCDGFGLIEGDRIQFEGQSIVATVLKVNYETATLTLDRDMNWTSGLGVSFEYEGARPDIGAHEYSQSQTAIPPARPRVYLTPEDIPVMREKIKTERFREAWETVQSSNHPFAMALESLITGDTALAALAAVEFLPLLKKSTDARIPLTEFQLGACIYDWCYYQMDESLRQDFIKEFKRISSLHSPWYPARKGGNVLIGHDTEGWLLCGQLPAGLAIYDEDPDMFDAASAFFLEEFVPAREFVYKAHMHHQGDSYGMDRFVHDLFATWLFHKIGRDVFPENQKYVPYQVVYNKRPDGRQMRSGDNYDQSGFSTRKSKTLLISGSMYNDPYQLELYKSFSVSGIRKMLELIFLPLEDISKPLNELPTTKYFPHPMGEMVHRTGWEMGDKSNDAIVHMRVGNYYFGNHQTKDFGIFQIYYKGPLAISSGQYGGARYGSEHWRNYLHKTISRNGLLIFDPDERIPNNDVNDGGQRYPSEEGSGNPRNLNHLLDENESFKMAEVTAHSFGPDQSKPRYSYLSGDISLAYSPNKAELVTRSMLTLNTDDMVYPALFFVFDRLRSSNPDFKKTWLIHSIQEPIIKDNVITIKSDGEFPDKTRKYNGKLISQTLLPENAVFEKIGGEGKDFWVQSQNYYPEGATVEDPEKGAWRVEVSPSVAAKENVFFHAMAVTQAGNNKSLSCTKLNTENFYGVALQEYAVFFAENEGLQNEFVYKAAARFKGLFIADLKPGNWEIRQAGKPVQTVIVSDDQKSIFMENVKKGKINLRLKF